MCLSKIFDQNIVIPKQMNVSTASDSQNDIHHHSQNNTTNTAYKQLTHTLAVWSGLGVKIIWLDLGKYCGLA